jgi:hypothetical protein
MPKKDPMTKAFEQALSLVDIYPDQMEFELRNGMFSTVVICGEHEARSCVLVPVSGEFSFEDSIVKPSIKQLYEKLPKPAVDA